MSNLMRIMTLTGLIVAMLPANVALGSAQDHQAGAQQIVGTLPGASTLGVVSGDGIRYFSDGEWVDVASSIPAGRVVMADGDPPVLLAGEHDPCMAGDPGSPLQRSVDGGATWETPDATVRVRPLAIWPDGVVLAADCAGLKLSTDSGTTWNDVEGLLAGFDVTAFAAVEPGDESDRVALVGMTSEGGTTSVHSIDLSDPTSPLVSDVLRTYYAVGGLAGSGQTYVQVAMDGAWVSTDAGLSWQRQASGLEGVTLEQDPVEFGLPVDFHPDSVAMESVQILPGETQMVAGTANGAYLGSFDDGNWEPIARTQGRVDALAVSADGSTMIYSANGKVRDVTLPDGKQQVRVTHD